MTRQDLRLAHLHLPRYTEIAAEIVAIWPVPLSAKYAGLRRDDLLAVGVFSRLLLELGADRRACLLTLLPPPLLILLLVVLILEPDLIPLIIYLAENLRW